MTAMNFSFFCIAADSFNLVN